MENPRTTARPQIEVKHLHVEYPGGVRALRNISLNVYAGETLGLVGESGCGKSTLGSALIGDIPGAGRITSGQIKFKLTSEQNVQSLDLAAATEAQRRKLWGRRAAMVFQDPYAALNPAYSVGDQIDEAVRQRPDLINTSIRDRTLHLLEQAHIPDPIHTVLRFPHQLSGGQQQRVVIAMALAANPDVFILDEPTTGLDVTTEARILSLLLELKQTLNAAIVFITHNLAVLAHIADRIGVMYAGELVEIGVTHAIFQCPSMPYTAGLLACIPRLDQAHQTKQPLRTIPGVLPSAAQYPAGCPFAPRCPFVRERCRAEAPELFPTSEAEHLARCFFVETVRRQNWPDVIPSEFQSADPLKKVNSDQPPFPGELTDVSTSAAQTRTSDAATTVIPSQNETALLAGQQLSKIYGHTLRKYWFAGPIIQRALLAINNISFELEPGKTLGVVGESGCGKTTLVNCISGLVSPSRGRILLDGQKLPRHVNQRSRSSLRRLQMVFQNPDRSLNPQHTVAQILTRSIRILARNGTNESPAKPQTRVRELLEQVGLGEQYLTRRPAELSGGEKQRIAIARALAGKPDVLLADEITSALDVSIRAAILNLLNHLQAQQGIAYLFISHDMSAIRYVSDRVMVLYLGMVMEMGSVASVFEPPYHPYTEALMSAIPIPDPDVNHRPIQLEGTVPGANQRPEGCPFHTRCPRKIGLICEEQLPPWRSDGNGHQIFCHLSREALVSKQSTNSDTASFDLPNPFKTLTSKNHLLFKR